MKYNKTILLSLLIIAGFLLVFVPSATTTGMSPEMGIQSMLHATCIITYPSDGAIVSGIVTITVSASGTPQIYIDGVRVAKSYSYNWDTTEYSDGSHKIYARARGASDTINVIVNNGGGNNPPVVTITSPSDGATVSGTTTITVTVTDEDTLVPDIYIDSTYITTAYSYDWDTTAYADGSHTIYAEATDSGGLTGSDQIGVTVDNGGGQGWSKDQLVWRLPWWNDVIDVEQQGYTGQGSVVVILDTGLVANWQDYFPVENILTEHCRSYTLELGKDNIAWDEDTEGHGSAVTGTIIGYRLDSTTDYWIQGVAEDAKIVMLRCLYWTGGGVTGTELLNNWADAINYARSLKANQLSGYNMVISISMGYDYTNDNLGNAIDGAEAEGIVVVTSAGNSGPSADTTAYPANYADTTSVGACGYVGLTGAYGLTGIWTDIPENDFSDVFLSDFSSRGKVDVVAIGENLVLPYYGGYYYISGTSFSCPQTSGVYALMFEAWGSQSVAWLESKLQSTAVDLGYSTTEQGAGFVQADGATS
ncbi:MAG: S8 family serine peptidase [Candidatus Hermodarchaeota archaeon]